MAGLKLLKMRLENVKSIQKITSAMKLVSSVKFKKLEKKVNDSKDYSVNLEQSLLSYIQNRNEAFFEPELLYSTRELKSVLILVYSAAKGLCGSYNMNMSKVLKEKILAFQKSGVKVSCFCIGRKFKPMLETLIPKDQIKYLDNVEKQISIDDVELLSRHLMKRFNDGTFDGVFLLYNEFISAVKNELKFHRLIPFTDSLVTNSKDEHQVTEFYGKQDAILKTVLKSYITAYLYRALVNSLASEHSTRMVAMDGAKKNADEMIKALNLEYNKKRQAMITNELIEVISGAEAV